MVLSVWPAVSCCLGYVTGREKAGGALSVGGAWRGRWWQLGPTLRHTHMWGAPPVTIPVQWRDQCAGSQADVRSKVRCVLQNTWSCEMVAWVLGNYHDLHWVLPPAPAGLCFLPVAAILVKISDFLSPSQGWSVVWHCSILISTLSRSAFHCSVSRMIGLSFCLSFWRTSGQVSFV